MTGQHDARDARPPRSKRTSGENAARLAEMATLSTHDAKWTASLLDEAKGMLEVAAVELRECAAEREQLRSLADLAVDVYEADRAWQLAPEHREDLWETWVAVRTRFEVAVAEEAERRG